MPMHSGLLPREGFSIDVILRLVRSTALNPSLILPLAAAVRFTEKGSSLSTLYPTTTKVLYGLLCAGVTRVVNGWLSNKVLNNWVSDKYDWAKEIVVVTGGAGGIGGEMVKLFEENGITVVVLDVQPMTFETCK